jgi:hypothetical protein
MEKPRRARSGVGVGRGPGSPLGLGLGLWPARQCPPHRLQLPKPVAHVPPRPQPAHRPNYPRSTSNASPGRGRDAEPTSGPHRKLWTPSVHTEHTEPLRCPNTDSYTRPARRKTRRAEPSKPLPPLYLLSEVRIWTACKTRRPSRQ